MTKVKSTNRTARMIVKPLLRRVATSVISILVGLTGIATSANAAELNIYSHRQQFLLQPFLDAFTAETGIITNVVYASKGLAQRLKAEGEASPADVILTVDIARLSEYADLDLLSPVDSAVLNAAIPSELRASDNRWFAFSTRARLVVTSKERVAADAISNIEELADPQWEGLSVPAREAMSTTARFWHQSSQQTVKTRLRPGLTGLSQTWHAGLREMIVLRLRAFSKASVMLPS